MLRSLHLEFRKYYKMNLTVSVLALATWAIMTRVCVDVVVLQCSCWGVVIPWLLLAFRCWLISGSVLPVWLFSIRCWVCLLSNRRCVRSCVCVCGPSRVFCGQIGVKDMSNTLLCAGSRLRVGCLTVVYLVNCVLHCHYLVLHTVSPVRCILSLHCFIVVLFLVLLSCEGM